MTRTYCPRANLIAHAESLAAGLVALTEQERAAYRAAYLADPFSRPTFERAHRRATAARDMALEYLIETCDELCREGLASFAMNLQRNAIARCEVAIDLASAELADEIQHPDRKDSIYATQRMFRDPQGSGPAGTTPPAPGPEVPGLPHGSHARQAGRPRELCPAPASPAEGGHPCA